jgi:PIN domain nuclease of toxin-antitoxin system
MKFLSASWWHGNWRSNPAGAASSWRLPVGRYVASHIEANGFRLLGIELDDVATIETLPLHHRDPFDRLLVAQARNRKLPVISSDRAFSDYGIKRIW